MSDATARLWTLAQALADAYITQSEPRAILLVGSGATGGVDGYSDIDMLLYYDDVPAHASLAAAREQIEAERFKGTDWPGEGYSERYYFGGIQCQLGHAIISTWEREIAQVVNDLDLDSRLIKQLMGLFEGRALHGEDLIARWRTQAEYTVRAAQASPEDRHEA